MLGMPVAGGRRGGVVRLVPRLPGVAGTIHSFAFGLLDGAAFVAIGRVWPLVLGHALYDIRIELMTG